MKRWNRTLAALLAAIMLMGPWSATAELALEFDEQPETGEAIELEIAPEADVDVPDADLNLELDDALALDGFDIEDGDLELATVEDAVVDSAEAEASVFVQANASDSDFEIDENGVLVKYRGYGGDVVIPDGVTSIGKMAFYDCNNLASVTIPDSVTSIGEAAFYSCAGLASVTIPDSVTSIGEAAFRDCDSLASVTIPDSVTSIGYSAFYGCDSLTNVTIPDSVTSIGEDTFYWCSKLTSVTIGNGVTSIGKNAFINCDSLTSVTIPDSVTSIGDSSFSGCDSLTSVTLPDSVTSIGRDAFVFCGRLTSVTIGNGVTSIGQRAFYDCDSLASVNIPDSVTSIGYSAFYGCDSLSSVIIGKGVTSIESETFYNCDSLTSVTIPDSVTSIGVSAFSSCDSLSSVIIGKGVTSIGSYVFRFCKALTSVTIYATNINIGYDAFYSTNDDLKYYTVCNSNAANRSRTTLIHNEVFVPAVEPTYTELGKTEGTICTVCGKVFSGREEIPMIELSKSSIALEVNQSDTLEIISLGNRFVTWSSSDGSIASVVNGTVTAVSEGKCTIYATFADGHSLACEVTVTDPASLSKDKLALDAGNTISLSVEGLSGRTVAWSSSDNNVAAVENGTITGIGEGNCTITATLSNGKRLDCAVTISDPARLSKTKLSTDVGQTYKLEVNKAGNRTVTWSSSDERIAVVEDGTITGIGEGNCTITATLSNGKRLECVVTINDPAWLSKTKLSINVGKTYELEVNKAGNRTVTWSSSDERIAMVEDGTITAIGEGNCTITATLNNGKKLECTVTVDDPAWLSETELTMNAGTTSTLKVNKAGYRTVTWTSSNKKVATVKGGTVTAVKAGKCTITATLNDGKKLECAVTVKDPAWLSKTKLSMNAGATSVLKVYNLGNRTVTWSSSDKKVATVKNGTVTAIKAGKCTITAKVKNGKTFNCKVTVQDTAKLNKTKLSMKPGDLQTLKISGLNNRKVTWSSSNKKVATVKDGKITAVYIGKCTITAQIENGKKLTCKVTVTDPAKLSNDKLTISNIDTDKIKLTGGLNRKVTWSTSNKNVVEITGSDNDSASIKAVRNGAATITAKVEGGKTLKCVVKVVDPLTITVDEIDEESVYNELWVYFNNHSNKKITYVTLDIAQYNNRGDRLKSPYDYYYLNETVSPHDSLHHYYWVNDDTKKVRITITEVTFADKTTWRP